MGRSINNPLTVPSHAWVLRGEAVVSHLFRGGAICAADVNLEVADAIGTPDKTPAVGREPRVPIVGGIIREPTKHSVGARDGPNIEIATTVGGENDLCT